VARPRTFQLVRLAPPRAATPAVQPPAQTRPAPPKPPEPKPAPRQAEPKPAPPKPARQQPAKPQPPPPQEPPPQEDLSELEELLGAIGPPSVEYAAPTGFKYNWYLNAIMSKVEQHWKPPYEDRQAFVEVAFTIFRNGTISDVQVKRASGNAAMDNLAVRAVMLAAPFGELPVGWSGNSLDVRYTLRPTRK
jgi:TonB family protein